MRKEIQKLFHKSRFDLVMDILKLKRDLKESQIQLDRVVEGGFAQEKNFSRQIINLKNERQSLKNDVAVIYSKIDKAKNRLEVFVDIKFPGEPLYFNINSDQYYSDPPEGYELIKKEVSEELNLIRRIYSIIDDSDLPF